MASSEVERVAGWFGRLDAGVTGASGLASMISGRPLTGLTRLSGAAALAWTGVEPDRQRLRVAAAVSAGLAALDLAAVFGRRATGPQRARRLAGAVYHGLFAVLHHEAARDLS